MFRYVMKDKRDVVTNTKSKHEPKETKELEALTHKQNAFEEQQLGKRQSNEQ